MKHLDEGKNRLRACFWNVVSFLVFIYSSHVHQRQFRGWGEYWLRCTCHLDKVKRECHFKAVVKRAQSPLGSGTRKVWTLQESVFFGNHLLAPSNKLTRVCSTSWDAVWVFLPLLRAPLVGVTTVSSSQLWSHSGLTLQGLLWTADGYSSHVMCKAAWADAANLPDLPFLQVGGESSEHLASEAQQPSSVSEHFAGACGCWSWPWIIVTQLTINATGILSEAKSDTSSLWRTSIAKLELCWIQHLSGFGMLLGEKNRK